MTLRRAPFLLVALTGLLAILGAFLAAPAIAQESLDCYPIPEQGCVPDEVEVESDVDVTPDDGAPNDDRIVLTSSDTEVLSNVLARTGVTVETLVVVGSLSVVVGFVLLRRARSRVARAP